MRIRRNRWYRLISTTRLRAFSSWASRKIYFVDFRLQETYIIHDFGKDLYGMELKLCICGYLRPELNFDSLDALVAAIQKDINDAKSQLDNESYEKYRTVDFFKN